MHGATRPGFDLVSASRLSCWDSAVLAEQSQQGEDVGDIGIAVSVDISAITVSKGGDGRENVVDIASAVTVEVAFAATNTFDDAIQ